MEITVSQPEAHVPVTVVHLSGNLDSASYEQLQTRANGLINAGTRNLLLDLSGVPYMSSAGLRALNSIYKQLREDSAESNQAVAKGLSAGTYKSRHLKLLNPTRRVLETLKMSGMDMVLDIHHSLKDALASFPSNG